LLMTFSMMLVQFIYSILSNSLALLSDTLHMFSDVFALALSLAIIAVEKWQDHQKTFGYFRLEVLVAFINALTIILSALFII
ncbi:CDF family cation-efflux transporter CzcD, partial [Campylobacter jejuni]|nr:CDF family cation-efflux transporter CzcD [Campylobacter jejuni]